MKLELKHIAPYLPYGIGIQYGCILDVDNDHTNSISVDNIAHLISGYGTFVVKPILRPLSDFGNVNGFSLSDMVTHDYNHSFWLPENFDVKYLMHLDFEKLVSWHFDVFGLIDQGLAIDINTINK